MKKLMSITLLSAALALCSCADNSNPANKESSHSGENMNAQNGSEQNSSQNEGTQNNIINGNSSEAGQYDTSKQENGHNGHDNH